jgi:hypothetical protein
MSSIVGVCVGPVAGWASLSNGVVTSGTWQLVRRRSRRFDGGGIHAVRLQQLLGELPRPTKVLCELARARGGKDDLNQELVKAVQAWCEKASVELEGVPTSTIKWRATGKVNASKATVVAAANEKLGREVTTYEEAVALWQVFIESDNQGIAFPGATNPFRVVVKYVPYHSPAHEKECKEGIARILAGAYVETIKSRRKTEGGDSPPASTK